MKNMIELKLMYNTFSYNVLFMKLHKISLPVDLTEKIVFSTIIVNITDIIMIRNL